jgi:hypothetical protein
VHAIDDAQLGAVRQVDQQEVGEPVGERAERRVARRYEHRHDADRAHRQRVRGECALDGERVARCGVGLADTLGPDAARGRRPAGGDERREDNER